MKILQKISILIILILLSLANITFAKSQIEITSNKSIVKKDEEVDFSININDANVAALTLEIYWDTSKLEYVKGPENSNNLGNRAIYTWVSSTGENEEVINIDGFKFKAKEDGTAIIAVTGEFFNANMERVDVGSGSFEIKIGEEEQSIDETQQINIQNENAGDDNTDLAILRLNAEGINPEFNKDIKEYYFVTDKQIDKLDIQAVPVNSDAKVSIQGNENLKNGENTITINVESKDKTKNSAYKIYLTKTNNLDLANASLETLAIRQADLNPLFDSNITKYNLEIANNIDKIDILAIPQRENAKVNIIGNGEMKVGDNKIEIDVTAQNGTTHKKYEITVHRRNNEEETKSKEEKEVQAERLSAIMQEENTKINNNEVERKNKNTILIASVIIALIIASAIGVRIWIIRIKKK